MGEDPGPWSSYGGTICSEAASVPETCIVIFSPSMFNIILQCFYLVFSAPLPGNFLGSWDSVILGEKWWQVSWYEFQKKTTFPSPTQSCLLGALGEIVFPQTLGFLSELAPMLWKCYLSKHWVTQSCPTLLWPCRLLPARLLCPWNSPGKNTGVGCHFLLQGIFPTQGSKVHLLDWQADSLPLNHQGRLVLDS